MAKRLLSLNGLAIAGVILNHSVAWVFIAIFWWAHRYRPVTSPNFDQIGSLSYFILRFIEQLVSYSVPAFLFVSGFFIAFAAGRSKTSEIWKIAISRVKKLLIPFVVWSIIIFLGEAVQGQTYSLPEYLGRLVLGKATEAYYFIPLLCQYYLLSPLFLPWAKTNWKLLLIVSALVQFGAQSLQYLEVLNINMSLVNGSSVTIPSWFFPGKVFWFVFGIVISLHLPKISGWIVRNRWPLFITAVILLLAGIVEWELLIGNSGRNWIAYFDTALDNFYAACFILTFLAFYKAPVIFEDKLANLGTKSYGIYLVHSPVLQYLSKIVYHIAPWIMAFPILLFLPLLVVFGFGVPLMLMAAVKRSPAHKLYPYLFG
jgi:peptidoglycan/LPS O-acetylase OafA/YrhL